MVTRPTAVALLAALAAASMLAAAWVLIPSAFGWNLAWTAGGMTALAGMLTARRGAA